MTIAIDDKQKWPQSAGVRSHNELTGVTFAQHHGHYARMLPTIFGYPSGQQSSGLGGRVLLYPLEIPFRCTVEAIGFCTGGNAVGNFILGLYRDNAGIPDGGALLFQTVSAAVPGALRKVEVAIAPIQLDPGLYWFAASMSDGAQAYKSEADWERNPFGTYYIRFFDQAYGVLPNPCPVTAGIVQGCAGYLLVASVP